MKFQHYIVKIINKYSTDRWIKTKYFIILVITWRPNKYHLTHGGLLRFKTLSEMEGGTIPPGGSSRFKTRSEMKGGIISKKHLKQCMRHDSRKEVILNHVSGMIQRKKEHHEKPLRLWRETQSQEIGLFQEGRVSQVTPS